MKLIQKRYWVISRKSAIEMVLTCFKLKAGTSRVTENITINYPDNWITQPIKRHIYVLIHIEWGKKLGRDVLSSSSLLLPTCLGKSPPAQSTEMLYYEHTNYSFVWFMAGKWKKKTAKAQINKLALIQLVTNFSLGLVYHFRVSNPFSESMAFQLEITANIFMKCSFPLIRFLPVLFQYAGSWQRRLCCFFRFFLFEAFFVSIYGKRVFSSLDKEMWNLFVNKIHSHVSFFYPSSGNCFWLDSDRREREKCLLSDRSHA